VPIVRHVCPPNTIGRWPHCRHKPVVCRKGQVLRHGRCVTIHRVCPPNTIGKWPHCRRIQLKRPIVRVPQTHGSLTHRPRVRFPRTTIRHATTLH
jgi:hypothetical protein